MSILALGGVDMKVRFRGWTPGENAAVIAVQRIMSGHET
jgi:hypothetical protein